MNARKNEARMREAQQICAGHIGRNSSDELLAYLQQNTDLPVHEVVDSNGKTLMHECTFNDSTRCLKVLLEHAQNVVQISP